MAVLLQTKNKIIKIFWTYIMSKKNDIKEEQEQPEVMNEATETAETTENTVETPEVISVEEKLQEELSKEKDKFLRLFAEFENYKKRTSKERVELFKTAGKDILVAMLPVLDDLDRALTEISKTEEEELKKGVLLISNKLKETLKAKGLGELTVKAGDTFDAEDHEAVTQIPAPTDEMKGKIIDVLEKGYTLGDKIIRYPKVVVGQ